MSQSSIEDQIRTKLTQALEPTQLDVVNDSDRHAGHRSSPGTGNSHFVVRVVSVQFEGKSRIERHRRINEILAAELEGPIHALAISAYAPSEPQS